MSSLLDQLKNVENQLKQSLETADSLQALEALKREYLGKKSFVKQAFGQLRSLPNEERPQVATHNQARITSKTRSKRRERPYLNGNTRPVFSKNGWT